MKSEAKTYKDVSVVTPEGVEWLELDGAHSAKLGHIDALAWIKISPQKPKEIRVIDRITKLRFAQVERIAEGRTKGAGAGGFNRDVDAALHNVKLEEIKLKWLQSDYV